MAIPGEPETPNLGLTDDQEEKVGRKTLDEEAIVQDIYRKFARAKYHKESVLNVLPKWQDYYDFFAGDQWRVGTPDWVPRVGPNLCKMFVEVNCAILTSRRPEYSVRALSPAPITEIPGEVDPMTGMPGPPRVIDAEDIAGITEPVLHYLWDTRGFLTATRMALKGTGIYGAGFVKVRWDERSDDVIWEYVSPLNIYPDPLARDVVDAKYIIEISLAYRRDLERRFNVEIESDTLLDAQPAQEVIEKQRPPGGVIRILECWFDNGRMRALVAGQKLLTIQQNPLGTFPYGRFVDSEYENKFFPGGIIQDIIAGQKEINERRAQIHAWAKYVAWNKWRTAPGVDTRRLLSNMPNTVVQGEAGEIEALAPPAMPPYLMASPAYLLQELEVVTGIQDVSQGRRPPQLTAASAIERMMEASQIRIESKAVNLEQTLSRLGYLTLAYVKMFYDDDRILPFLDADQRKVYQAVGGIRAISDTPMVIKVQPGSTLSQSQGAMMQLGLQLFINKAIDAEAMLDVSRWPQRKRILERMKQKIAGYQGIAMGAQGPSMPGSTQRPGAAPGQPQPGGQGPFAGMTTQQLQMMQQQMARQMGRQS